MRRIAMLLMFALPLFGYEVRSSRYVLTVDVVNDHYDVRVKDVATNSVVLSEELSRVDFEASKTVDVGDRELRVLVHERNGRLNAELRVARENMIIDVLHAMWLTEPYSLRPAGEGPYRVGGDVKAPVAIKRVEPLYTAEAKAARISGIVIIEAVIDRNGKVMDAKVLKPLPFGLDQMAIDAVRQWVFRPGTLDGEPVDVIFNLTMNFKLGE